MSGRVRRGRSRSGTAVELYERTGPRVVSRGHAEVVALERRTVPIPGRPGWRRDPITGEEWSSAAWL